MEIGTEECCTNTLLVFRARNAKAADTSQVFKKTKRRTLFALPENFQVSIA
jgi:hypothetical protein